MPANTLKWCFVLAAAGLLLSGCGDDAGESADPDLVEDMAADNINMIDEVSDVLEIPDIEFPPPVVAVETVLDPTTIRAGERVPVSCLLLDAEGNAFAPTDETRPSVIYEPDTSLEFDEQEFPIGIRAGQVLVTCSVPTLGLIDQSPETLTIEPADPAVVITNLDVDTMTAGETATASCQAWDVYGNETDASAAEIVLDVSGDGIIVNDRALTINVAGVYNATCQLAGADSVGALLEVVPGLPANLVIAKVPDQQVYGIGQVVSIVVIVTDAYGNVVENADVDIVSSPAGLAFGDGRFRYDAEGVYTITVTVSGPTEGDVVLQETTTIVVNSTGPAITCNSPADGTMVDHVPGTSLGFTGEVGDTNGVSNLTVNGASVSVAADGTFSTSVATEFGINFVDIVATDQFGEQNSRTCAFLVSDHWTSENGFMNDAVSLKLAQNAVDDGNTSDLDSLNDFLYRVLNSQGLVDTLRSALSAANPLKPWSCDQQVCLPFVGCSCVFRSEVLYRGLRVDGPNTSSLTLVNGGLRAQATVRNVDIDIRVRTSIATINGTGTLSSMGLDATFDLYLQNGQPRTRLRSSSVSVGNVSVSINGLPDWLTNFVVGLFQNQIRNLLRDQIRSYVESQFNSVLDGIVRNLDISGLGSSFNVPRLDGSGNVNLSFAVRFSSLGVTSARALFGIGTRFTTTPRHARNSLGVPRPSSTILLSPSTTNSRPVAVTVYISLLNHVLHALWRAGFFDVDVGGLVSGLPSGTIADLETSLPPVAAIDDDDVRLSIGGMRAMVVIPGVIDSPLVLSLGAVATTGVALQGDDLAFQNIVIDELHFSADNLSLDPQTRQILENFLRDMLQAVLLDAVNNGLPALPIPSFELPASLSTFGLPGGSNLGIIAPVLSTTLYHFVLTGRFGILP